VFAERPNWAIFAALLLTREVIFRAASARDFGNGFFD
jgi:hypothetical protein